MRGGITVSILTTPAYGSHRRVRRRPRREPRLAAHRTLQRQPARAAAASRHGLLGVRPAVFPGALRETLPFLALPLPLYQRLPNACGAAVEELPARHPAPDSCAVHVGADHRPAGSDIQALFKC